MTRYAQRTLVGQPSLANWGKTAGGFSAGLATGGTASDIAGYKLLTFTGS